MQTLTRGFIFRIFFIAAQFAASILVAKLAGTGNFGILSLMIINATLIKIITGLGTDAAIVWHGVSGKISDQNTVFSFTVYSALIQLLLFITGASLCFLYFGKCLLSGEESQLVFFAEILFFTGLVLTDKFTSLFYSQQLAAVCNRVLTIGSVVYLLFLVLLWIQYPEVIADYTIQVFCFYAFLPALFLIIYYFSVFHPRVIKINRQFIRSFIDFSIIVLVTNIIQYLAFRADFWFLDLFHEKQDVGIYAQASKFAQLIWVIPGILAGLIIPALRNEKNRLSDEDLLGLCRMTFYIHLLLSLLAAGMSFVLYRYFLPEDYSEGFLSLLLMLPGYILFTITTLLAAYYSAFRLLKINLLGSVLCFVCIISLDLVLIPEYSYNGAALSNMIAYILTTVYFIQVSKRFLKSGYKDFFIFRKTDMKLFSNLNLRHGK